MFRIFSGGGGGHPPEFTLRALNHAVENNDVSQVPVIVEALRFLASQELIDEAVSTLRLLTNQKYGGDIDGWHKWTEWHGEHAAEFQPPEGYVEWKINLLSIIDPRYRVFLWSADETSRIDLTEIVWGGARPDGIPDLQSPPNIPADDAYYLDLHERVFGVSINGQHRAYPLRIMNAHEMANDVLGGEPIALAY
jgi:hypothetical protein